jgi:ABC-2 type transport system permease protein
MFLKLYSIETTKIMRRSILWVEMGLMAILLIVINIFMYSAVQRNLAAQPNMPPQVIEQIRSQLVWPGGLMNSLGFSSSGGLGGLLVIVLVGAITAQEYTWRAFHLLLSRGTPRLTVLSAKFAALVVPILLIVLTPLVVGGMITAVFSLQMDGSLNLDQLNVVQLFYSICRTAYTLLPYAGLAFLLAVVTRSAAAAIGMGIAYSLLVEGIFVQLLNLLGEPFSRVWVYLPTGLNNAILTLNEATIRMGVGRGSGMQENALLDPIHAAIGIAIWTIAIIGLAVIIFKRQDLTE